MPGHDLNIQQETGAEGPARRAMLAGLALLLFLAAAACLGVIQFARGEYGREKMAWASRLEIVAGSRMAAVNTWLGTQRQVSLSLASNTALRLYATQIAAGSNPAETQAMTDYLNALLAAAGEQSGFWAPPDQTIRANLARPDGRGRGIAYIDSGGAIVASTPGMPDVRAMFGRGVPAALSEWRLPSGQTGIAAVAPVRGVQAEDTAPPLGWIVAVRPLDQPLFEALVQPGDMTKTGRTLLLHAGSSGPEFLLPADERPPFPESVSSRLFGAPEGFSETGGGDGMLVSMHRLPAPEGWRLLRVVGRDEALGDVAMRWQLAGGAMVVFILAVAALILLVWRHGASIRLARMAEAERQAAGRYAGLSHFLRMVTDRQPTLILALDRSLHLTFANARAAEWSGGEIEPEGKSLSQIFGHAGAEMLSAGLHDGLEGRASTHEAVVPFQDRERSVLIHIVPLAEGASLQGERPAAVLLVAEDLTELMAEKAMREKTLKGLVSTLTAIMDARDPFAAGQSTRVAEVAGAIARAMMLDSLSVETVETAGLISNLGKMLVPRDVLVRAAALTQDELRHIRYSLEKSADLVEHLAFRGPVAATLRQAHLRFDGRGQDPAMHGENILLTARILAVANAFVAMTSPRAHRKSLPIEEVMAELQAAAGTLFDRAAIAALAHVIENEGGRDRWSHFARAGLAPDAA